MYVISSVLRHVNKILSKFSTLAIIGIIYHCRIFKVNLLIFIIHCFLNYGFIFQYHIFSFSIAVDIIICNLNCYLLYFMSHLIDVHRRKTLVLSRRGHALIWFYEIVTITITTIAWFINDAIHVFFMYKIFILFYLGNCPIQKTKASYLAHTILIYTILFSSFTLVSCSSYF